MSYSFLLKNNTKITIRESFYFSLILIIPKVTWKRMWNFVLFTCQSQFSHIWQLARNDTLKYRLQNSLSKASTILAYNFQCFEYLLYYGLEAKSIWNETFNKSVTDVLKIEEWKMRMCPFAPCRHWPNNPWSCLTLRDSFPYFNGICRQKLSL